VRFVSRFLIAIALFSISANAAAVRINMSLDCWSESPGDWDPPAISCGSYSVIPHGSIPINSPEWGAGVLSYFIPPAEWQGDPYPGADAYADFPAGGSITLTGSPFGAPITILSGTFAAGGTGVVDPIPTYEVLDLPVIVDWANPEVFGGGRGIFVGSGSLFARLGDVDDFGGWYHFDLDFAADVHATPEPVTWPLIAGAFLAGILRIRSRLRGTPSSFH
jgi:hypothetical protein